jgi:predicted nucleic acid-binding Zn ribbon protein
VTDPKPLRRSLDKLLDDLGSAPVQATTSLADHWGEVVGPALVDQTSPAGVRNRVLVIEARDPAVANHLEWQERTLLARLDEVLGAGVVTGIRVRIRGA